MPPGFYTSNLATRTIYAWLQLSEEQLATLMTWKPGVHKLNGVSLPRNVEYTLSCNLKYIFPITRKSEVAWSMFEELTRKVGWITHFWQKRSYQPDWDLIRKDPGTAFLATLPFVKSKAHPPHLADNWFNEGLQAGREFLSRSLTNGRSVPRLEGTQDVLRGLTLSPKDLHRYLMENDLLSFISDKNLGVVVTTRQWYEKEVSNFLENAKIGDLPLFLRLPGSFQDYHKDVCEKLDKIRREWHPGTLQIDNPIRDFLSDNKIVKLWDQCWTKRDIPRFHGIPKIHKNPWKLRPIVPMHSYVTSSLAILLHHMLLPIQRKFSWICESSRTLASEVADYNKSIRVPTRLHTGDVTAMYTSIAWVHFRQALASILTDHSDYDQLHNQWILEAAELCWKHTVFQADGMLIEQQDGIPMGLHCAPVFANLYMAAHEIEWLSKLPDDFFYRRYIDDCFVIFPLDDVVHSLSCPGLTIQWADSEFGLSFLDVYFHTHQGTFEICFKPFEKALNNHQYLPWASDHPISVKKGMIKGELSRIRAISYRQSYFLTWKETFLSRLRLRGWPRQALSSWARQVQWRNHFPSAGLDARKNSGTRLIVVSKYNPVWEEISSTDLWRVIRNVWSSRKPDGPAFPSNLLIAKKRTTSMWDVLRSANRNLLQENLEEIALEDLPAEMSDLDFEMDYEPF